MYDDRAVPEDAADHRRPLEERLLGRRQRVDARRDQGLERVGDPLGPVLAVGLDEHPDRLLDEERVALGLLEQVGPRAAGLQPVARQQRVDQLLAFGRVQRVELDRGRAHPPSAPARAHVEQLGPGEADEQERRLAHPRGEMLDQLEQRLLGPVDVLEDEHERLDVGELSAHARAAQAISCAAALVLDGLEHARGEPEQVGDRLVLAAGAQLLHRLLDRVVVRDPGSRLDHLGERPVGDALPVREAAAAEHGRALERRRRTRVRAGSCPRPARRRSSRGARGGRGPRGRTCSRAARAPCSRPISGAASGRARRLVGAIAAQTTRQAASGSRRPLTSTGPTSSISRLPSARLRAAGPIRISPGAAACCSRAARLTASPVANVESVVVDDDLARLDPDPRLEPERVHRFEDPDRGSHGALGVVLVRLRDPEGGEHGVAGELLHDAAVRGHAVRDPVEEARHAAADDLGVGRGDERGRADEIDEQHGGELALHPSSVETNERPDSIRRGARPEGLQGVRRPRASIRRSSTRTARSRSGARTSSSSSRGGSPSAATRGCRRPRWRRRRSRARPPRAPTSSTSGMVGTEMVYFAVGELGLDGGIMVTASHNPKEYTGMKIVRAGRAARRRRVGARSTCATARSQGRAPRGRSLPGRCHEHDVWPAFVERVLSFVDVDAIRPLRVVIDAANGMAGVMLPPVLERLPVDVVRCYFEPDGSFPNHEPNPLLPENREFIVAEDAGGGGRPRRRVRRRRRPLLLRRRHRRVRPRRLRDRAPRRERCSRRSPARR